jgi:hypothetical protein
VSGAAIKFTFIGTKGRRIPSGADLWINLSLKWSAETFAHNKNERLLVKPIFHLKAKFKVTSLVCVG